MPITRRQAIAAGAATAGQGFVGLSLNAAPPAPRQDVLWYRQPASTWTEALPVGNGRLGAMVFGGIASERIQLNEDTLWSGGPYEPLNPKAGPQAVEDIRKLIAQRRFAEAEALADECLIARPAGQMSYQTFGDLFIDMDVAGTPTAYHIELDIDTAIATTLFATPDGNIMSEVQEIVRASSRERE